MKNYVDCWEVQTITEEEFIFDSLRNRPFFDIFKKAELHMLHCVNEGSSLWDNTTQSDDEKSFETSKDNNEDSDNFLVMNDDTLPTLIERFA